MIVHGYAAYKAKDLLKEFTYEPEALGPGDVEIKISHCGICHSDVHLIDNDWGVSTYPLVPGHEIVGTVIFAGKEATYLKTGQRVGVGWQAGSCMHCEWCVKGEENLCNQSRATCVGHYGGFADTLRVDSRFAFPIPQSIESENAAPLLCGGITVYSPIRRLAKPQMKAGVVGVGGLGHLAIQFAGAMGCEVTAFSSTDSKEKEAREFGAHHFIVANSKSKMKDAYGSLDFILSTVPADLDWGEYVRILRPNGKLVFVGAALGALQIAPFNLIDGQKSISGSVIGGRSMITEMLDFAARHGIKAKTEVMNMRDANQAVKRVRENKARYRMVLAN